jgi:plasmid stability protein
MPDLLVDVPDDLALALEKRAQANGRSAEAEHRAILLDALKSKREDDRTQSR